MIPSNSDAGVAPVNQQSDRLEENGWADPEFAELARLDEEASARARQLDEPSWWLERFFRLNAC